MPLFTWCNIGLGCPQNVSVKFQLKIPHRSFIITSGKYHFWGMSKKRDVLVRITLNANELHIPAISRRRRSLYISALHTCSNKQSVEATWPVLPSLQFWIGIGLFLTLLPWVVFHVLGLKRPQKHDIYPLKYEILPGQPHQKTHILPPGTWFLLGDPPRNAIGLVFWASFE